MRVFITGASAGIGEGLARRYARVGANIGLVARRESMLRTLAQDLEGLGATARIYAADVADSAALQRAANDFVGHAGGIDLVIANAGLRFTQPLHEIDAEAVARVMSVNVAGVTNTIVPFIPVMLAQRSGTLVAMGSWLAHRALPGRGPYSASKAAVKAFMDALRMELHGTGVHAMTLCPAYVRTEMTNAGFRGKLPFELAVDEAVRLMVRAIERREKTYTLPWQMNLLRYVYVAAPEWLVRRLAPAPPLPERGASSAED